MFLYIYLFYNVLCFLLSKQSIKELLYNDGDILYMNHIMALIGLISTVTAAKLGDVKRRGGMFRVVTACRCCKRLPFSFHVVDSNDAPKTTRRKNVVIAESWIRPVVNCILTNPAGYLPLKWDFMVT